MSNDILIGCDASNNGMETLRDTHTKKTIMASRCILLVNSCRRKRKRVDVCRKQKQKARNFFGSCWHDQSWELGHYDCEYPQTHLIYSSGKVIPPKKSFYSLGQFFFSCNWDLLEKGGSILYLPIKIALYAVRGQIAVNHDVLSFPATWLVVH